MKHRTVAGVALSLTLPLAALLGTANAFAQAQVPPSAPAVLLRNDALSLGEPTDEAGHVYRDHPLTLQAGETLDVALTATFDAVLRVAGPQGFTAENDDAPNEGTNARLRFTAPTAGVYVVTATSSTAGEAGWFSLVANHPAGAQFQAQPSPSDGLPHVYGLFVGVTQYPDSETFRGAEDAAELAQHFAQRGVIRRGDAVVLTNGEASSGAVQYALAHLGARMTERDSLVFYFGGHGGVNSMAMPAGSMTAAELSEALDRVPGRQLVALDSCHSGSFEWVVQRSPRRAGLFSSTAGELSYTATRVNSSGWLAYFLLRASEGEVPTGSDHAVQLSELASFVRAGYRSYRAPQTLVARAGQGAGNLTLW